MPPFSGQVFFFQSELPYDANFSFADKGFVGYKVESQYHKACGLGVYSNFRDFNVDVKTELLVPNQPNDSIQMKNMFTVKLDNMGKISSVVNGKGPGPTSDIERGVIHRYPNMTSGEL